MIGKNNIVDAASLTDIMVNTEYLTDGANLLMHDREVDCTGITRYCGGSSCKWIRFN